MQSKLHLAPVPAVRERRAESLAGGPDARPIRVVLADDHAFLRRSLRLLLEGEVGFDVIAEGADIDAALQLVQGELPDVLVFDLSASDGSSLATMRRLRERASATQIVVLTMEEDPAFARRALDAGASGYVLKEMADVDLPRAVRAAAARREFVSSAIAGQLASRARAAMEDHLTPREIEVLRLIALGHTSAEVAAKLGLSVRTVETHRARIHRKLDVSTRAELVRYALRRGLLVP